MTRTLITGGRVYDHGGDPHMPAHADLGIERGAITAVAPPGTLALRPGDVRIDARGCVALRSRIAAAARGATRTAARRARRGAATPAAAPAGDAVSRRAGEGSPGRASGSTRRAAGAHRGLA